MTGMYDAYKPMRNYLRQCALERTLEDMWQLSQHVANPAAISAPVQAGGRPYSLDGQLFPWDLPAIAREVLLHSQQRGGTKRLNSLSAVQTVVHSLRNTCNEGSKLRNISQDDVFNELLRISHHQFPWQQGNLYKSLTRHLKIFGAKSVAAMLEKHTGLTVGEFFFLGFAIGGHLQRRFDINSAQEYGEFGITEAKATAFFSRLSVSIDNLRPLLAAQPVDATWDYGWNPLEATPLVALDPEHPNRMYCPVPDLLLRRFSTGLYYDLVKVPGFGNAFGTAFEDYVGEVLAVTYQNGSATVLKEVPYTVGRDSVRCRRQSCHRVQNEAFDVRSTTGWRRRTSCGGRQDCGSCCPELQEHPGSPAGPVIMAAKQPSNSPVGDYVRGLVLPRAATE